MYTYLTAQCKDGVLHQLGVLGSAEVATCSGEIGLLMTSETHTMSPHVRVVRPFGCQAGLPTELLPVSVNIDFLCGPPHLLISANCGVLENVI